MKTHNLVQGSPEWLAYRFEHHNASEAAAMLGLSKTTTRTELLHMKHTGLGKEFSDWVQRHVLDYGHEVEAKVRLLVENMIGEELYPVTCSEGRMSASLDGMTMSEEITFECKQWNAEISAQVACGIMPEQHMPQCQQILMVTGAKKVIFAVGDGTPENLLTLDVYPDPEWFARIRAGWAQFAVDLETYVPAEAVATPVGRSPETLPALHIEVTGMVTASNLAEFKSHALAVFGSINRELTTDVQFADAEKTVKWCGEIESRLAAAKQHALSQTESIDALFRTIDDISAEARTVRLELDKLVKARKESIRLNLVMGAKVSLGIHIDELQHRIGKPLMPTIAADFDAAIKGKRTIESLQNGVNTELARAKIEANAVADRITLNLRTLNETPELAFLFADVAQLVLKAPDDLAAVVQNRINSHQAKEAARIEADCARIAAEERAKAEAAERARAEAQAQAQADAEAKRASDEAIARAREQDYMAKIDASRMQHNASGQPSPTHMQQAQAAIETVAHQASVCEMVQTENAVSAASPLSPPTLRLGQICERLGFNLTADFMRQLGFEPAATDKAAKLYHENDFPNMCAVLVRHIQTVAQGVAA